MNTEKLYEFVSVNGCIIFHFVSAKSPTFFRKHFEWTSRWRWKTFRSIARHSEGSCAWYFLEAAGGGRMAEVYNMSRFNMVPQYVGMNGHEDDDEHPWQYDPSWTRWFPVELVARVNFRKFFDHFSLRDLAVFWCWSP